MSEREQMTPEAALSELVSLEKGHFFTAEEEAARIRWARRFIAQFEGIGRAFGYGVFHGGSLVRDIDIVCVPWRKPMPLPTPDRFVMELHHILGTQMGNYGDTLHGHRYFALWVPGHLDHQIDLKIIRHEREDGSHD